uniref:Uncharacterized protein n=1 Tax=Amphimedon queenslandica TaxID=400682 RepID=A0A1X7VYW3_AMPQE
MTFSSSQQWEEFESLVTKEQIKSAYLAAIYSMARLNKTGAKLMHRYGAHGATDVLMSISFVIHSLPILDHMDVVALKAADNGLNFKLREGFSAETSGGLVVILSKDQVKLFCKEIEEIDKVQAWIIGDVIPGSREASISPDMKAVTKNLSLESADDAGGLETVMILARTVIVMLWVDVGLVN